MGRGGSARLALELPSAQGAVAALGGYTHVVVEMCVCVCVCVCVVWGGGGGPPGPPVLRSLPGSPPSSPHISPVSSLGFHSWFYFSFPPFSPGRQ